MTDKKKRDQRSSLGYGSSYRKGRTRDLGDRSEIGAVMGGQIWMVKPDKGARSANPCIWMQSGVVDFKDCNNFYDCVTCKYDLGMKKKAEKGKQITWQDAMRKRDSLDRICRHSLTNRIANRSCAYDYQCSTCDFDQFFEDVWSTKTGNRPFEVQDIKGLERPLHTTFIILIMRPAISMQIPQTSTIKRVQGEKIQGMAKSPQQSIMKC